MNNQKSSLSISELASKFDNVLTFAMEEFFFRYQHKISYQHVIDFILMLHVCGRRTCERRKENSFKMG